MSTGIEWHGLGAATLLAFGIIVPVPAFSGGMLLALGCCYAIRAYRGVDSRKSLGLSLFVGALTAMIVAAVNEETVNFWLWGAIPLQIQMALAGLFSQAAFEFIARKDGKLLAKLADKAGIGGGEK